MENISVADFWFHHVHGNCAQNFSAGCIASDSEMAGVKEEPAFCPPSTDPFMVGVVRDAPEDFRSGDRGH